MIISLRPMRSDSAPESGVNTIMHARLIDWAHEGLVQRQMQLHARERSACKAG